MNRPLPEAKRGNVEATLRSPGDATYAQSWQRKSIRLPADSYVGTGAYLLTVVTSGRKQWFAQEPVVRACEEELHEAAAREFFELLAYVFMPEHLHLLVQGTEQSSLSRFMKDFKQRTGFHFKQERSEVLWQKSFHDHALRNDEGLEAAAFYLAQNPERRGLASMWHEYPFWGGVLLRDLAGDLKVAADVSHEYGSVRHCWTLLRLLRPSLA